MTELREIGLDTRLGVGDKIVLEMEYSYLPLAGPSEAELYEELSKLSSINVEKVEISYLSRIARLNTGAVVTVTGKVAIDTAAQTIALDVKDNLANLVRVFGVNTLKVSKEFFTIKIIPEVPPSTAVTFVAVAVVAIVLLIVMVRLGIKEL